MTSGDQPGEPGRSAGHRGPILHLSRLGARHDDLALYSSAFLFSFSLAMAGVALPLLAVEADYHASEIGLLVGLSALMQVAMRWLLAGVMRRVSNATIVGAAAVSLAVSNGVLAVSAALVPMVVAALAQGLARACFWTGSQTHVVRSDRRVPSRIAWLNLVASAAMVAGPMTAGLIAGASNRLAFAVATAIACGGVLPALALERPPPFVSTRSSSRGFMRRPGVAMGVSANAVAGGWRGVLGSYVPVSLETAGRSSATIGVLVTLANAASVGGSFIASRVPTSRVRLALVVGSIVTATTTMFVGFGSLTLGLIALALAGGGVAVGVLHILGITVASESVPPELRGDAVAVAGALRAVALFVAPVGVAGLLPLLGIGPAVAVVASLMFVPVPVIARAGRPARISARPSAGADIIGP
jgi:MFS family permease